MSAMKPKPRNYGLWAKMIVVGLGVSIGGPALVYYVQPTPEELRERFNPDLKKRNLEKRSEREEEFEEFVTRLKQYSKSDKPIWVIAREEEQRKKQLAIKAHKEQEAEAEARRDEMRKEAGLK